jgi:thiol:disulfide interchange protein DsbA
MNPRRRTLLAVLALSPLPALAQMRRIAAGVDYSELRPQQPVQAGKIEVIEFFWYGCPSCYKLEPLIEKWVPRLPGDVLFHRIPALLNEQWAPDAAAFYTFEALGVLNRLHRPYFDAIHRDRVNTRSPAARNDWLQKNGVDVQRFESAYKSFGVQSKVRRAQQLTVDYRVDGTPAMAVHGRYTISVEQARTFEAMLGIADYLIDAVRKGG